jgi:hypothetical protein
MDNRAGLDAVEESFQPSLGIEFPNPDLPARSQMKSTNFKSSVFSSFLLPLRS